MTAGSHRSGRTATTGQGRGFRGAYRRPTRESVRASALWVRRWIPSGLLVPALGGLRAPLGRGRPFGRRQTLLDICRHRADGGKTDEVLIRNLDVKRLLDFVQQFNHG